MMTPQATFSCQELCSSPMVNRFHDMLRATPFVPWMRLVRICNVPIGLSAVLTGALAATPRLDYSHLGWLCLWSLLSTAAVQSFNDYEDQEIDSVKAKSRPIPSGALSAHFVLWNGYICATLACTLSLFYSANAAVLTLIILLLTRWYSRLKKATVFHHVLIPAGVALAPVYGAKVVESEGVPALAWVASLSIFLVDINMNVVDCFKDVLDGSPTDEKVLAVVLGPRAAVFIAMVAGMLGISFQVAAVSMGLCTWHPLVPLAIGAILHVESRTWLFVKPTAKEGARARKLGWLTDCAVFPALMFGVRDPLYVAMIVALLVATAFILQALLLKEAALPDTNNPGNNAIENITGASSQCKCS